MIDATCPLVTKVHVEAVKFAKEGYSLILIGHRDHDEVIGTLGEAPVGDPGGWLAGGSGVGDRARSEPGGLSDADHAQPGRDERHHCRPEQEVPEHQGPGGTGYLLCHGKPADGGEAVASDADLLLVVGSENSSNSNRLVEVARNLGTSHLIDSYRNIRPEWLEGVKTVALTAGASAPECLVEEVVKFLAARASTTCRKWK